MSLRSCLPVLFVVQAALAATESAVLVPFDYPDAAAARAAWVPSEDSLPVDAVRQDGRPALRLNADFTGASRRAVYDHDQALDLSRWGRFTLDVFVSDPGLVGNYTLYFRTDTGWYGAGFTVGRRGWSTVSLHRSAFNTEGQPSGWDKVKGIRISAWRGAARKGWLLLGNLTAWRESIVVVVGTSSQRPDDPEARSAQQMAEAMSAMIEAAGLMTGTTTDEEVGRGSLEGRTLAILPHNPSLSEAEAAAVERFIAGGGKVLLFYQAPHNLPAALGFRRTGWSQQQFEGQLSELRFTPGELPGLPGSVAQHSWNLTLAEPITGQSKVLGWWHDNQGRTTNWPAIILSPNGAFMSHVLTPETSTAKQQLLLALLGHFEPDVWPTVAAAALKGPERLGHIEGLDAARAWTSAQRGPRAAQVKEALAEADTARRFAANALAAKDHVRAIELAHQSDDLLRAAYLDAHQPRPDEFRAFWNHSGTGAHGDWAASMKNLHEGGFNAIVPNMLWGGVAHYDSALLPHSPVVAERGDQIAACVAAAKPYGIEVHVWKVNWNLGAAPAAFRKELLDAGRLQVGYDGTTVDWLCPSDPRNLELEAGSMVEVARKYQVDGVHFDYIRYPDRDSCFCARCRTAFERALGGKVADWPADTRKAELAERWTQFRCDTISRLVERVARDVRAARPDCQISAAVFSNYPGCRGDVGQDWVHWIERGWLDFVCPMDYTESDVSFATTVARQRSLIGDRVPLYPGIGASASRSALPADRVAGQIGLARWVGADGFIVFNYARSEADGIVPGLGRGILSQPAATPHHTPAYTIDVGEATLQRVYARHLPARGVSDVTVARDQDPPGLAYRVTKAELVLEDATGALVQRFGAAPIAGQRRTIQVAAPAGLYRVVVRGEATVAGASRQFARRSVPLVFGELAEDVAANL